MSMRVPFLRSLYYSLREWERAGVVPDLLTRLQSVNLMASFHGTVLELVG